MYTIDHKKKDTPESVSFQSWTAMASPYKREGVQCKESLGIVL